MIGFRKGSLAAWSSGLRLRRIALDPDAATLLALALLVIALHVPRLFHSRLENDERVFLALGREMSWSLDHYTTRDDPDVRTLPSTIYRQELFLHPPLLPLVLKVGLAFGRPVLFGLAFELCAALAILYFVLRAGRCIGWNVRERRLAGAFVALCPILNFSTSRLHTDGLLAAFLIAAIVVYIESLESDSLALAGLAGCLFVLALNARFAGLIALPVIALLQSTWIAHRVRNAGRSALFAGRSWRTFAVVLPLVSTLGMQHYYRVLATYGTLVRSRIYDVEPERYRPLIQALSSLTRLEVVAWLLAIYPVWALVPLVARRVAAPTGDGRPPWRLALALAGGGILLLILGFSPSQLRYYAPAAPLLHLAAARAPLDSARATTRIWRTSVVLSLVLMLSTTLWVALRGAHAVIPLSLYLTGLWTPPA